VPSLTDRPAADHREQHTYLTRPQSVERFVTVLTGVARAGLRRFHTNIPTSSDSRLRTPTVHGSSRRIILVGHFTPPIHGMAVAMDALATLLESVGPLTRIRTVPKLPIRGRLYHLARACLVSRAACRLLFLRSRATAVFLSVDAGQGMLYTIALTWVARRLGYRVVLQHHSNAYISRRSRLAATLVYAGGPSAEHLYSCQLACDDFRRLYPRALKTRALSVSYAVESPTRTRPSTHAFPSRQFKVGHLSNLTLEKGLDEVIRFGRAAIREGKIDGVILAGPVEGATERALIDSVVREPGFEYRGMVTGRRKDDFYRDIDVFLLPTRYRNELSPLVVVEAALRGVPVITYRVGCLTQEALGNGNLVLDPGADFTARAISRVETWSQSPGQFAAECAVVAAVARRERERSISDALMLGADLFGVPPQDA
jgi:glycosyltransferase involved in cell wall biosynthesis